MNLPSPSTFTPDIDSNATGNGAQEQGTSNEEMQRVIEEMYARQQQMEAELRETRAALNNAGTGRRVESLGADPQRNETNTLLRSLIEALSANSRTESLGEVSGPRDWKPPTWDGRADTFRDYLLRLRSSYRVRAATKPQLSAGYYWDRVYDTLPSRERARMRHFWEKGSADGGKDPETFFTQLENVFADSNEQAKALERLTNLRHFAGQPWHEHQLEFDGLLLSAGGDSWTDPTKIGYLRNTFSNPAKVHTATVAKTSDYYVFSEEVERIMTNLETTDQFKAANKRWLKEKSKESDAITTVSVETRGLPTVQKVDADGDTVIALTRTGGNRSNSREGRRFAAGKRRAKWVDTAERERRREKKLCFRCGGSGHRIRDCPYAPAVQPTTITATRAQPLLEGDEEGPESPSSGSGKE